jgi:2-polyprenyl-6-methoxyphenol hydroxylase-like FAD-dependent oxidoreductase
MDPDFRAYAMTKTTVLIIGGGIAGPAIALFLKKAGLEPIVFETYERASDIGGGLQIAPNGMRVLSQLDLAEPLRKLGVESAEFCFENESGKLLTCLPNGPASRYGLPAIFISRSALHAALLSELERQQILIHYSKRLKGIASNATCVTAEFADGSCAEGSILIGADGIHSQTRQIVFPDTPPLFYTGLMVIGGFAQDPALQPASVKLESRAHMIYGANGFFGYGYYDPANPTSVMWWSHQQRVPEPSKEELDLIDPDMLRKQLIEQHRGWAEPVPAILRSAQRILWGPIHDLPDLKTWSKGRVVLIGDAAHAISPHAGQGVSLALEDALCLAKHLRKVSYGDAFVAYQQDRQSRVEKIVAEARKRGEAKHALTPGAARIRNFMLGMFLRLRGNRMFEDAYRYAADWD